MVGLVLVSHSRALAKATVDLIRRTVAADVPIEFAGGVGEDRKELGTDGTEIFEAINAVYSEDGVLVLMDMGSAILSAETAKDFLEPDQQAKVRLTSAPLVEGSIAAAIQAQLGSSVDDISKAAQQSLLAKQEHLSEAPTAAPAQPVSAPVSGSAITLDIQVENEHGLHLRPAAVLIKGLARFHGAQIFVENRSKPTRRAVAKSLVDIARLQIRKGDLVRFTVSAQNAPEIIDEIKHLVEHRFGEKASPELSRLNVPKKRTRSPKSKVPLLKLRQHPKKSLQRLFEPRTSHSPFQAASRLVILISLKMLIPRFPPTDWKVFCRSKRKLKHFDELLRMLPRILRSAWNTSPTSFQRRS
jgi:dihydroxyacetone kinase phosphotransfer subunit